MVRDAVATDLPVLLELMRGLADYEGYLADFRVTEEVLRRQGFERVPPDFHAMVAVAQDQAVLGMLVYHLIPFTYRARPTLFIKELYVVPAARGRGIGEALMQTTASRAVEAGCALIKWQVARWNETAARLYRRLGAVSDETWVDFLLHRETIERLASGDPASGAARSRPAPGPARYPDVEV